MGLYTAGINRGRESFHLIFLSLSLDWKRMRLISFLGFSGSLVFRMEQPLVLFGSRCCFSCYKGWLLILMISHYLSHRGVKYEKVEEVEKDNDSDDDEDNEDEN